MQRKAAEKERTRSRLRVCEVVDDAAGRADDDVRALGKCDGLRHHVDAADQRRAAHADDGPERLKLSRELGRWAG